MRQLVMEHQERTNKKEDLRKTELQITKLRKLKFKQHYSKG